MGASLNVRSCCGVGTLTKADVGSHYVEMIMIPVWKARMLHFELTGGQVWRVQSGDCR
jgi:hypothetical protein